MSFPRPTCVFPTAYYSCLPHTGRPTRVFKFPTAATRVWLTRVFFTAYSCLPQTGRLDLTVTINDSIRLGRSLSCAAAGLGCSSSHWLKLPADRRLGGCPGPRRRLTGDSDGGGRGSVFRACAVTVGTLRPHWQLVAGVSRADSTCFRVRVYPMITGLPCPGQFDSHVGRLFLHEPRAGFQVAVIQVSPSHRDFWTQWQSVLGPQVRGRGCHPANLSLSDSVAVSFGPHVRGRGLAA